MKTYRAQLTMSSSDALLLMATYGLRMSKWKAGGGEQTPWASPAISISQQQARAQPRQSKVIHPGLGFWGQVSLSQ